MSSDAEECKKKLLEVWEPEKKEEKKKKREKKEFTQLRSALIHVRQAKGEPPQKFEPKYCEEGW